MAAQLLDSPGQLPAPVTLTLETFTVVLVLDDGVPRRLEAVGRTGAVVWQAGHGASAGSAATRASTSRHGACDSTCG